jgi:hypothetical protein
MASLVSRIADLAAAIRAKLNTMTPRLLPAGGAVGQTLTKTGSADYAAGWSAPPTSTIALVDFTVTNSVVSFLSLYGVSSVTRIAAGRYRCTFATPQADLLYAPFSDVRDAATVSARILTKTLTYFEVSVTQLSLIAMTAVDAAEVFASVGRKN